MAMSQRIFGRRRKLIAFAAPLAAAALLVAGCGDDDDEDAEAATQWASEVCGALADWEGSITTIAISEGISQEALSEKVDDAEQATRDLVDQLKAVGVPETDEAQEVTQEINQFADNLESNVDSIKQEAEGLSDADAAGLASGLAVIAADVSQVVDDGKQVVTDLEELEPDGQLSEAIKNDETCQAVSGDDEE